MKDVCNRSFSNPVLVLPDTPIIVNPPTLMFGDFMVPGAEKENKIYEEIRDIDKLRSILQVKLNGSFVLFS